MVNGKNKELICPNCNIKLSFNGGTLSGSMDFRICWKCNYQVEDIKKDVEVKNELINN